MWYTTLGEYSFPTVFVRLEAPEAQALIAGETETEPARHVQRRLRRAIKSLPGFGFVGADCCAPTDSVHFEKGRKVAAGAAAWRMVITSEKVRSAFERGDTDCLTVRPYRHMDKAREFRMFFHQRNLVATSQYCLLRYTPRLDKRSREIWRKANDLADLIAPYLPSENQVVDIYLCSDGQLLVVDLNPWAGRTDPKLLRTWDRDWQEVVGLKLVPKPIQMKGDVSVSF